MKFTNILVPVDFSEFSSSALDYALYLAKSYKARITILHVIALYQESFTRIEHLSVLEEVIAAHEKERKKLLEQSGEKGREAGIDVKTVIIRGISPPSAIFDYMSDKSFDLIVMGNHGNTGLKKFFLGSVSQRVLHMAKLPVLTVHKGWEKRNIKNILVPVDFSEASERSFHEAARIGEKFSARLHLLHVVEQDEHPEFYNVSFEPILRANPQLEGYISDNLRKFSGKYSHNVITAIREGKSHMEIDRYIEESSIDLLVMSCRGNSLFENILIGSTTEKMVAISGCPVLVMPG